MMRAGGMFFMALFYPPTISKKKNMRGGFPKKGDPEIIYFNGIFMDFPPVNQPFWIPPFIETPIYSPLVPSSLFPPTAGRA